MFLIKRLAVSLVLLVLSWPVVHAAAAPGEKQHVPSPDLSLLLACRSQEKSANLVQCLSERFLILLKKNQVNGTLPQHILVDGEKVAESFFSFSRMASSAFGREWLKLDLAKRQSVVLEFKMLLFSNYSRGLARFADYQSSVVGSEDMDRQSIVRTVVRAGQKSEAVSVDYYLFKIKDQWMIYDVSVAGISLVASYRQQIEAVYAQKGVDGVLDFLHKANGTKGDA